MSNELQKAIKLFCQFIPECKIGKYSPNPNDDRRLKSIYDVACSNSEEIRASDIIDCLKELKPEVCEKDIVECGDTAFKHMLQL